MVESNTNESPKPVDLLQITELEHKKLHIPF